MADYSIRVAIDASLAGVGAKKFADAVARVKAEARGVEDVRVGFNPRGIQQGTAAVTRSLRDMAARIAALVGRPISPLLDPRGIRQGAEAARAEIGRLQAAGDRLDDIRVNLSATGADEALRDIRALAAETDDLSSARAAPGLDASGTEAGARQARAALAGLSRAAAGALPPLDLTVRTDVGEAEAELQRLGRMMADLRAAGRPVDVAINADTAEAEAARRTLAALAEEAVAVAGRRIEVDLPADAVRAGANEILASLGVVRRATEGADGTIELRADTAAARAGLAAVRSMLADLARTADAGIDLSLGTDAAERDAARAAGLLDTLGDTLRRLSSSGARVVLGVETGDADAEVDRLSRSVAALRASAARPLSLVVEAPGAGDAARDIRAAADEAVRATGRAGDLSLGVDASRVRDGVRDALDGLAEMERTGDRLEARDISPGVDAAPALRALAALRAAVVAMDARLELSPDLDTAAALRDLAAFNDALGAVRSRLDLTPELDGAAARREIAVLDDALAGLRLRVNVPVELDADTALRRLRVLAAELVRLRAQRAQVDMPADAVEASADDMVAAFLDVQRAADAVDGTEVRVGLDAARLRRGIADVSAAIADLRREGGVDIPLGIDTADIAAAADRVGRLLRQIAGQTGNARIPLELDLEGLDEETRDLSRRIRDEIEQNLEGGVSVEASLDVVTAAAMAEVDRFMAEASRPVEVPFSADTDRAEAQARALRDRLRNLLRQGGVDVPISADASGAIDAAREAVEAIDGVSEAAGRVSRTGSFFGRLAAGAKDAVRDLANFRKEAERLPEAASEAQVAWRQFFEEMETAEIAIEVIGSTAVAVAEAITSFEDMESALQAVTGTALKAENAFAVVRDFAQNAPFEIQDVTDAFVALKSGGLDANRETLAAYGNMASALNLTLKEMAEAVSDAAGGDFTKLNETMVKGEQQGARVILTYRGVRTEVENSSRAIAEALENMGNTTFAGGMEQAAEGVGAAFDRVKNAATEFSNAIGSGGLNAGLENFSNALTEAMAIAKPFAELLGGALGTALTDLSGNLRSTATELAALANLWNTVTGAVSGYIDAARGYVGLGPAAPPSAPSAPSAPEDPVDAAIRQEGLDIYDVNFPDPREKHAPLIREGIFLQRDDKGNFQTQSNGLSLTAPDDRDEKRIARANSRARSQAEAYQRQSAALKAQVDMLRLTDEAYDRGRTAVEQYRNSMEELSTRLSLNESVGKKNAESLVDLAMDAKDLQETLAFKGAVLDMTEQIGQAEALAGAYETGTAAVRDQEAANAAWNKAVELGRAGRQESVQQLYDLEKAAQAANARLAAAQGLAQMDVEIGGLQAMVAAYEQGGDAIRQAAVDQEALNFALQAGLSAEDPMVETIRERIAALRDLRGEQAMAEEMAGMDREIISLEDMADAYRTGGSAVRDATIAHEAYAMAVRLGVEHDDEARQAIELKTRALQDMREANETARRSMEVGFDLEQAERELGLIGMTGEAREIEAARIELLMDKKRSLGDATATLTDEEERLAVAMAQVSMAAKAQDTELMRLATSIPNMATAWDMAAAGSLMHFEDALVDIVTGAKSAREAFADMAKSIAADLARMAIRMAIIQPLAMMFGGGGMMAGNMAMMGGGMAMRAHTGGVIGTDALPLVPAFHTGGVAGFETPAQRRLPPIASWTRYHAGGLAADEVPAVLKRGEGVFTPGQMAALAPAGGPGGGGSPTVNNISVNVTAQQGVSNGDAERQGRIIAQQIEQAMNEKLSKELRNGGLLNPNGY